MLRRNSKINVFPFAACHTLVEEYYGKSSNKLVSHFRRKLLVTARARAVNAIKEAGNTNNLTPLSIKESICQEDVDFVKDSAPSEYHHLVDKAFESEQKRKQKLSIAAAANQLSLKFYKTEWLVYCCCVRNESRKSLLVINNFLLSTLRIHSLGESSLAANLSSMVNYSGISLLEDFLGYSLNHRRNFEQSLFAYSIVKDYSLTPSASFYTLFLYITVKATPEFYIRILARDIIKDFTRLGFYANDLKSRYLTSGQMRFLKKQISLPEKGLDDKMENSFYQYRSRSPPVESSSNMSPNLNMSKILLLEQFSKQCSIEEKVMLTLPSIGLPNDHLANDVEASNSVDKICNEIRKQTFEYITQLRTHKNFKIKAESTIIFNIPIEKICDLVVNTALKIGHHRRGVLISTAATDIGKEIVTLGSMEYRNQTGVNDYVRNNYSKYLDWFFHKEISSKFTPRSWWLYTGADVPAVPYDPPVFLFCNIGLCVIDILVNVIRIDASLLNLDNRGSLPLFMQTYTNSTYRKLHSVLVPHNFFASILENAKLPTVNMFASYLPMLCPPIPWLSLNFGGYLFTQTELIRFHISCSQQRLNRKISTYSNQFNTMYDAINNFSNIPWKIDLEMLSILMSYYENGGDLSLSIPLSESKFESLNKKHFNSKHDSAKYLKGKREMHSLRMDMQYRLSIANWIKDNTFWLPSNMDFRGRCYDIPPHFNHLGADNVRSLFRFAQGRPLGKCGLKALYQHLANLSGFCKKMSLAEREAWVISHKKEIYASAEDHRDNHWWTKMDEPWQALSTCRAILAAESSSNPEEYICSLPIHQDGSCNGLQHYAALGRDIEGGKGVNIYPSAYPNDVYQRVCDLVISYIKDDFDEDEEFRELLLKYTNRRVVKQTVMTTVYGVTMYGAVKQIKTQLQDQNFPEIQLKQASSYLTKAVFKSIKHLFKNTAEIQNWLVAISKVLSDANICTEWVTPLGLPIVQPYFTARSNIRQIVPSATKRHRFSSWVAFRESNLEIPSSKKQAQAFPPNFIHSLDSTHMLMTSLACSKKGIWFVHIHDSFWTHASSIKAMGIECRKEFINLHQMPLLTHLSEHLKESALPQITNEDLHTKLNGLLTNVPKTGDLDLNNVLDSTYFFS